MTPLGRLERRWRSLGEPSNQEQPEGDEDTEDFRKFEKVKLSVHEPENDCSIKKINVDNDDEHSF